MVTSPRATRSSTAPALTPDHLRAAALALGFDACHFAPAQVPQRDQQALQRYLDQGWQGSMDWLARRADERADPRRLWPDAQSVIVLGVNYGPEQNPLARLADRGRANLSVYAENRDYHDLVKKRLKQLARWLVARQPCEVKVFVDTAPVLERALAAQSGLGWQGKHSNLVSRRFGSWLLLGEIFTTLDLPPDPPEPDHCGSCRACLDICPTGAIIAPYQLDARRCLSYWTIEHPGPIPVALRSALGNRVYGCDDCLAVCPWNKFAQAHSEPAFAPRAALTAPRLADFLALDDAAFRALFSASPIKRIGRDRFLRNCAIAAGNAGAAQAADLLPRLEALCADPSPLVAEAAHWGAAQLRAALAAQHQASSLNIRKRSSATP